MRRSKYEADAQALDELYQAAHAELVQDHRMDDSAKSLLITLVLEIYYAGLGDRGPIDFRSATKTTVSRFKSALQ